MVGAAESAGLTPILDLELPPAWAYDTAPTAVNGGSPNVSDLGDFATALATHYDGLTAGAPAEHVFEVWNEPNLSLYMSPVSASTYRDMVNAVADAVHAIDTRNLVVAGGLDPYGHPKGKHSDGMRLRRWPSCARSCVFRRDPIRTRRAPTRSTSTSGHTIRIPRTFTAARLRGLRFRRRRARRPAQHASAPEGRRAARPRRVGESGPILGHGVRLEHEPAANAFALARARRPLDGRIAVPDVACRRFARDVVSCSRTFRRRATYQSGLFFDSASMDQARPKPMRTAFRFPFVAYRHRSTVGVWGRDGRVTSSS